MEITKRDWIAMQVNVEIYNPADILERKLGQPPTVQQMADYVASIRYVEADAILSYIERH